MFTKPSKQLELGNDNDALMMAQYPFKYTDLFLRYTRGTSNHGDGDSSSSIIQKAPGLSSEYPTKII